MRSSVLLLRGMSSAFGNKSPTLSFRAAVVPIMQVRQPSICRVLRRSFKTSHTGMVLKFNSETGYGVILVDSELHDQEASSKKVFVQRSDIETNDDAINKEESSLHVALEPMERVRFVLQPPTNAEQTEQDRYRESEDDLYQNEQDEYWHMARHVTWFNGEGIPILRYNFLSNLQNRIHQQLGKTVTQAFANTNRNSTTPPTAQHAVLVQTIEEAIKEGQAELEKAKALIESMGLELRDYPLDQSSLAQCEQDNHTRSSIQMDVDEEEIK